MSLERGSPCKVNLLLNILGKRPDGFHELETILQPVGLNDSLRFERGSGPSLEVTCSDPRLPLDSTNLVTRSALAFFEAAKIHEGVRIHLEKRIPLAAGLGGGSGNAAQTLLGLNEIFGSPLDDAQLSELARGLGSDVPFFLQTGPALATGRGEQIVPLPSFPALRGSFIFLAYPGFGVPTAWAYQQLPRFPSCLHGTPGRARMLLDLLQTDGLSGASGAFYNSLEPPVFRKYPLLALFQEFLREQGAISTLMSGSGSTTFALAASESSALNLEEKFREKFGKTVWTAVLPL